MNRKIFKSQRGLKKKGTFPEVAAIDFQYLTLLKPSKNFPEGQRTVYFKPTNLILNKREKEKEIETEEIKIEDKEYMVVYNLGDIFDYAQRLCFRENGLISTEIFRDSNLVWTNIFTVKEKDDYMNIMTKYQKIGFFPSTYEFKSIFLLTKNYNHMKSLFANDYNFMPKSLIFAKEFSEQIPKKFSINNLWLIRRDFEKPEFFVNDAQLVAAEKEEIILMKYITNPLLFNRRKFLLNAFVLITGYSPLKIYVYKEGLTRFAGSKYSNSKKKLSDRHVYLTNYEVAKTSKNFKQNNEENKEKGLKWTISTLRKHFEKEGIDFENKIWSQIKDIIVKIFITYYEFNVERLKQFKLNSQNLFDIYGVDILIDDKNKNNNIKDSNNGNIYQINVTKKTNEEKITR